MLTAKLLLTEREAAASLQLSRRTLYTLRTRGQIPYLPVGRAVRYDPAALREWARSRNQGGQGNG